MERRMNKVKINPVDAKEGWREVEKKLAEQEVYSILKGYHIADVTADEIAEAYSISVDSVRRIVKGRIHTPMYTLFKAMYKESIIQRKRGGSKITETDVLNILDLFFNQEMSQAAIAEKHYISRSTVAMIVAGHRWTEVYQQFNKRNFKRMA
jgi:predicted DNA-binding protein YlxM (UPF0122 family)